MSEMVFEGDGSDKSPDEVIQDALIAFTGCVGNAVEDVCSYGLTIGETYVPFDPDPEDDCDADEAACSQLWVRVMGVQPTDVAPGFGGTCALSLRIDIEVGILRCLDIPEGGEAPTATDVLVASMQSVTDMRAILCAALGCEVWDEINAGTWSPTGPLGGQYGGIWTFSAELS